MADFQRPSVVERDTDQAITALKKGAHLLKYGRRGKPKFCPFRLSTDESTLIWYYGKDEKHLDLHHVSRIIPGQRTAVFQRYPRPEKEYQSFSLIYNDRSLDLICKDKDEAEVWFAGLKALIARGSHRKTRNEPRTETAPDSPRSLRVSRSSSFFAQDHSDTQPQSRLGKAFAEVLSFTASSKNHPLTESPASAHSTHSAGTTENSNARISATAENANTRISGSETIRVSLSSGVSSSSHGSCSEDFENLGDVFIWGEGSGSGVMGGGMVRFERSANNKTDALIPKALESTGVLDVQDIACGQRHAVVVTKQGEIYSWGEDGGGRLGHGVDSDVLQPKIIESLSGKSIEMVACGDYHTCAITHSGDLYTWGDGSFNCGLLGQGSEASHWFPKRVCGPIEGLHVSFVSCGPWHTALVTFGQLFTFGDGTFGALGHGDCSNAPIPREVEALKGLQTEHVACGVWHTAAVVKMKVSGSCDSDQSPAGKLFTWGDGEYGQLGHGDNKPRLVPQCILSLVDIDFSHVACGNNLTVGLTTSGKVYTMGKSLAKDANSPTCVKGNIANSCVEEIACGSHHIAVLTSKAELYTWGKGGNGQLGHGDNEDRTTPTLVNFLKEKHVKRVACGSNFTAAICLHKWISSADNSVCSGCHNPFNFIRKRHNCYNCGLGFCTVCSTRKSLKASLAPSVSKPYRVCDDCFTKLEKTMDTTSLRIPFVKSGSAVYKPSESAEKDIVVSRWPGSISRLSFGESLKCDRMSSVSVKTELHDSRIFPLQNGSMQRSSDSSKSPSAQLRSSLGSHSFLIPDNKTHSQSASPLPGKSPWRSTTPSPSSFLSFRTHEATTDETRSSKDGITVEVKSLRVQVERLTSKSRLLEAELGRKSLQLKDMTARAADEAEKSKAAKEVIKSLTAQLKEMAERVPEQHVVRSHLDSNEQTSNDMNGGSNGSINTSKAFPTSECSGSSTVPLSNGTEALVQKSERTIQDEPGVYITLLSLHNGVNELRRVRFSRKHFTEEQAEKWWAEKGRRVCEHHNIRTT